MRYITLLVSNYCPVPRLDEYPALDEHHSHITVPYDPNTLYQASLALGLGAPPPVWDGILGWARDVLKEDNDGNRT